LADLYNRLGDNEQSHRYALMGQKVAREIER